MAIVGAISLVFAGLSLIKELSYDRYPPFFGNSWVIIIGLFFFLSGASLIAVFKKGE